MNKTVVIIGGGPAGMSTALWLKYLNFEPIILEKKNCLGGLQKLSNFQNFFYLGVANKTGVEVGSHFENHIIKENIKHILNCQIESITKVDQQFKLITNHQELTAQFLVIATGQNIKTQELISNILGYQTIINSNQLCFDPGATPLLETKLAQKTVGVIGGGDNGLITAIRLANYNQNPIHLLVRSKFHGFKTNQEIVFKLAESGKIIIHQPAEIKQFQLIDQQIIVTLNDQELTFDFLCFRLGFKPNITEINQLLTNGNIGALELSETGYLKTDQFLRTSLPSVYACGDLVNDRDPCVATAVASGAIVARSIDQDWCQ